MSGEESSVPVVLGKQKFLVPGHQWETRRHRYRKAIGGGNTVTPRDKLAEIQVTTWEGDFSVVIDVSALVTEAIARAQDTKGGRGTICDGAVVAVRSMKRQVNIVQHRQELPETWSWVEGSEVSE